MYSHSWSFQSDPCFRWLAMTGGGRPGRRGRRGHPGRGPWGAPGHRGPRARRGDVRSALLILLGEEPRNGYQLMQEIERRSDGAWRPSPGSVYPALAQLEDEGLVAAGEGEGRVYRITDAGREWLTGREEAAPAPWDAVKEDTAQGPWLLIGLVKEIGLAAAQLAQAGDRTQVERAKETLSQTRRSLYRILAEEPPDEETQD